MLFHIYSLFLLDRPPCTHIILIVGRWSSKPITEAIGTLYYVPILCYMHYNIFPCLQVLSVVSSRTASSPPLSSSLYAAAAAAQSLIPASSIPSCSHHLRETQAPVLRTEFLQRSRIGHVVIYFLTVFCLFRMYTPPYSKPSSSIYAASGGYYQPLSYRLLGCLPVICRATLC